MASHYGKQSLSQKFNSLVRKTITAAFLIAIPAVPLGYQYGTVREQTVTVISNAEHIKYNEKKERNEGYYSVKTNKGDFVFKKSLFHGQSLDDAKSLWWRVNDNRNYRITTYGCHVFGNWQPNIVAVREVSDKELEDQATARVRADSLARARFNQAAGNGQNTTLPTTTQPTAQPAPAGQQTIQQLQALSGEVVTYPVVVGKYSVQLTVPVEVVGKVMVNTVREVAPRPPGQ